MPTYEYRCEKGCNFELFQKFNADNPKSCPKCGSIGVERQFSIPSIIYKGSGFYSTDYGSSKSRSSDPSETNTKDKTKSKESTNKAVKKKE